MKAFQVIASTQLKLDDVDNGMIVYGGPPGIAERWLVKQRFVPLSRSHYGLELNLSEIPQQFR